MNEILPNALVMGVDYELFWSLDPITLSPFIKAFSIRKKMEDSERWQLGVYIRGAVASVLSKDAKYPTEPIFSKEEAKKEETEEDRMLEIKKRFINHAKMLNSQRRREPSNET